MIKCTGLNCPMQDGKVDPATCKTADTCKWATKPLTNADKHFRNATDEELAEFIPSGPCPPIRWHRDEFGARYTECPNDERIHGCRDCWLDWLKQEVKDNA